MTLQNFAVLGFVLEVVGLLILLGRNEISKFVEISNKSLEGADERHFEQMQLLQKQRMRYFYSGVFIVAGISLQTLPEHYLGDQVTYKANAQRLEALHLCATSASCEMTVTKYSELLALREAEEEMEQNHRRERAKEDVKAEQLRRSMEASMSPLQKIRKLYPQYIDLSDVELGTKLHEKFYPHLEWDDFWLKCNKPNSGLNFMELPRSAKRDN